MRDSLLDHINNRSVKKRVTDFEKKLYKHCDIIVVLFSMKKNVS